MKHTIGNILATLAALGMGVLTIWASVKWLKEPQGPVDWIVLILSGITTGTLAFFITWGHFQDEPEVGELSDESGQARVFPPAGPEQPPSSGV